jgi:very-short-patch-repair endonuclease
VVTDPVAIVPLAGGTASAGEIVAHSGKRRLLAAVRAGRPRRVRQGRYALPALLDPLLVAARIGGVVSHGTAAQLLGLSVVQAPTEIHVTLRRGAQPTRLEGTTLHWTRHVSEDDVDRGVTRPLRTVLDCATTMPFAHALAVADSALALFPIGSEALQERAAHSTGAGRPVRRRVTQFADARADNAFESVLRAIVLDAGLVSFVPQVEIRLPGRVVRVDLADVDRRLILEADSYSHHGSRAAFARDCGRYNDLVAAGWVVLRFPWEHVMVRPHLVTSAALATCARLDAARARGRSRAASRTSDGIGLGGS